jgi:hypothetical protein
MAQLVRGPWDITWGGNTLTNIEEIEVEYERDSEDYTTVQHQTYELDGPIKSAVTLTFLASDVPALAAALPQFHVANGEIMSTGETVNNADGAIDVAAASCDESPVYHDLDIVGCANPGQVFRLVNARSVLDSIEFDDKIRKVMVKFIGEPATGEANVQFFKEGTINVVS